MKFLNLIVVFKLMCCLCSCELIRKYDFIIVGGGTAGLTLAHELSETSNITILILEAGSLHINNKTSSNLDELSSQNEWQAGKMLGGTPKFSYTIYSQGFQHDYNTWGENNPGWRYEDIKKYFLNMEKRKKHLKTLQNNNHFELKETKITTAGVTFFRGMNQLGYIHLPNAHKKHTKPGYSRLATYSKNRHEIFFQQTLYEALLNRQNVIIKPDAPVTKILINSTTKWASAVLARYNNTLYRIVVRKEIIVCAGVMGTSKILLSSGIGPKNDLNMLGIRILEDLPVGKGIRDHIAYPGLNYMTNYKVNAKKLEQTKSTVGAEAMAFVSLDKNKTFGSPDIQMLVFNQLLNDKFQAITKVSNEYYRNNFKEAQDLYGIHIFPILLHPKSSYDIKLSNIKLRTNPKMEIQYLQDEADIEKIAEAVSFVDSQLVQTLAFKKKAAVLYPVPVCLKFPYKSKAYWKCAVRKIITSFGDYTGGCNMGPVVDNELKVHGFKNVRIADASVIPVTISAPLEATVIMVAKKAADLLRDRYNLSRK